MARLWPERSDRAAWISLRRSIRRAFRSTPRRKARCCLERVQARRSILRVRAGRRRASSGSSAGADRAPAHSSFSAEDAYAAAVERDTLKGYREFLAAYPNSDQARRVRAILAVRREAAYWRRTVSADTPRAYWTYLRTYPKGPHIADARRRLAMLSADSSRQPNFRPETFVDLPPPPPDERFYEDRPIYAFDDFGPPPPPPPVQYVYVEDDDWRDLPPPPPPAEIGVLPVLGVAIPIAIGAVAFQGRFPPRRHRAAWRAAIPAPAARAAAAASQHQAGGAARAGRRRPRRQRGCGQASAAAGRAAPRSAWRARLASPPAPAPAEPLRPRLPPLRARRRSRFRSHQRPVVRPSRLPGTGRKAASRRPCPGRGQCAGHSRSAGRQASANAQRRPSPAAPTAPVAPARRQAFAYSASPPATAAAPIRQSLLRARLRPPHPAASHCQRPGAGRDCASRSNRAWRQASAKRPSAAPLLRRSLRPRLAASRCQRLCRRGCCCAGCAGRQAFANSRRPAVAAPVAPIAGRQAALAVAVAKPVQRLPQRRCRAGRRAPPAGPAPPSPANVRGRSRILSERRRPRGGSPPPALARPRRPPCPARASPAPAIVRRRACDGVASCASSRAASGSPPAPAALAPSAPRRLPRQYAPRRLWRGAFCASSRAAGGSRPPAGWPRRPRFVAAAGSRCSACLRQPPPVVRSSRRSRNRQRAGGLGCRRVRNSARLVGLTDAGGSGFARSARVVRRDSDGNEHPICRRRSSADCARGQSRQDPAFGGCGG